MKKHLLWIIIVVAAIGFVILGIYLYKRSKASATNQPTSTVHPLGTTVSTLPGGGTGPSING